MIVAFYTQGHGDPVPRIYDPGVLPWAHEHPIAFGRKPLEMDPAGLIRAVLTPHDRVHGQLEVVGRATQKLLNSNGLVVGQSESSMDIAFHGSKPSGPEMAFGGFGRFTFSMDRHST
jgi:hypothetical protein